MIGLVFLALCFYIGFIIINKYTQNITCKYTSNYIFIIPSSFILGTILLTWSTYILALLFSNTQSPLLYANIIVIPSCITYSIYYYLKNKKKDTSKVNPITLSELIFFLCIFIFWIIIIYRSFYGLFGINKVGYSVYSDFGPHLSLIRSFSVGSNFPTGYPHFAGSNIRYHFMFQFLCGNLEFLGLPLTLAFNIPSILSLLFLSMLLYYLTVKVTKSKAVAVVANILFLFRSSFALFTFSIPFKNFLGRDGIIYAIFHNLNQDGKYREHIGNTLHENWGLYAQKVYLNQRHLGFSICILLIVIILFLPYIDKMIDRFKNKKASGSRIKFNLKELFFVKDSWLIKNYKYSLFIGLMLGLSGFFNGAVVIGTLIVLFVMAIFSKNKLDYLITAVVTLVLVFIQTKSFMGSELSSNKDILGFYKFLADTKSIKSIFKYLLELTGLLIPICIISLINPTKTLSKRIAFIIISIFSFIVIFLLSPAQFSISLKLLLFLLIIFSYSFFLENNIQNTNLLFLTIAFLSPLVLVFTLNLTPDITVNHKYIMLAMLLTSIPIANYIVKVYKVKGTVPKLIAAILIIVLTCTGIVDYITVINIDIEEHHVELSDEDSLYTFVREETDTHAVFLSHYHVISPVLLAGRKIFYGWPYFTYSAGYDTNQRFEIYKLIYGSDSVENIISLAQKNNINYIIIENENRNSKEYVLHEEVFDKGLELAFSYPIGNLKVYKIPE